MPRMIWKHTHHQRAGIAERSVYTMPRSLVVLWASYHVASILNINSDISNLHVGVYVTRGLGALKQGQMAA